MAVQLLVPYFGYAKGVIASFDSSTESALVTQGLAVASTMNLTTPGQVTTNALSGIAAVGIGSTGVTIVNSNVNINTKIDVNIIGNLADATATYINRTTMSPGSFLVVLNAAPTTINVLIGWKILI